jgi:outer membrane protein insertion porin family
MPSNAVHNPRRIRSASVLFAMLAIVVPAMAQPTAPGGAPVPPRIREIRVEGTTSASPSAVINFSGLRVGDAVTSDAVARAIRTLMERRLFSDVKIFAEDQTADGVAIVIAVHEYPRVGKVTFTGHDELDDKEVTALATIRPGDIASPYEFDRTRAKVKAKYAEEGYLFTTVTASEKPSETDTGRVDVTFTISEGPEVSIGDITFSGNREFSESQLEGAMEDVKEKQWWQLWRSSKFDRTKLAEDRKKIEDFYHAQGFIDAEVVSDSIWIDPVSGKANVHLAVTEGERVYLRSIAITGNTVYETPVIKQRLGAEEGAAYNQVQLNSNVEGNAEGSDLRSLYLDNGYLTFRPELVERRVAPDSVDVVLRITEGQQASIRYVSIAGNTKTKDKVIRRELFTRPGDTFSKQAIIRSLRTLANLNYFNPERLQPDVQPVDATTVDVTYQVEERPSDTFNASVGFSSQGLTGVLGVSFNNFSIGEPLSGGGGQVLNFNWEFGSYVSTFSLGFTEPWLFDQPITLGANVYYRNLESVYNGEPYDIRTAGGTLNLGRRLRWPDDYFRLDLTNRVLHNEINGEAPSNSSFRAGSEISHTLTLSRSSLDNPFFATVGSRFTLANTYAGFGDAKFSKHELNFDFYSPLAQVTEQNSLVLYLNNEYGIVNDFGPLDRIAPTTFYNMGGTVIAGVNTIQLRGYEDNSIGPRSEPGRVYAKTTAELRFGLAMNPIPIYVLGFAEAGNVWGRLREVNPFDLKRSMGLGLRVMVPPIGLLGFDYGYGFDYDVRGVKGGWRFHFQFGR